MYSLYEYEQGCSVIAIIISAFLSALLWIYQKYSGIAAGSLPIVAQSVDSRNHLLVAGGVGASLFASYLGLPVVDLIVGRAGCVLVNNCIRKHFNR